MALGDFPLHPSAQRGNGSRRLPAPPRGRTAPRTRCPARRVHRRGRPPLPTPARRADQPPTRLPRAPGGDVPRGDVPRGRAARAPTGRCSPRPSPQYPASHARLAQTLAAAVGPVPSTSPPCSTSSAWIRGSRTACPGSCPTAGASGSPSPVPWPSNGLLIADEITSALDVSVQACVLNTIRGLQRRPGLSMLFNGRNLPAVCCVSDVGAAIRQGRIVETAPHRGPAANPAPVHPDAAHLRTEPGHTRGTPTHAIDDHP